MKMRTLLGEKKGNFGPLLRQNDKLTLKVIKRHPHFKTKAQDIANIKNKTLLMVQKQSCRWHPSVYTFANFYFKMFLPDFPDCSNTTWINWMIRNIKLTSTFGFIVFIFKFTTNPFMPRKLINEAMQDYIFSTVPITTALDQSQPGVHLSSSPSFHLYVKYKWRLAGGWWRSGNAGVQLYITWKWWGR